MASNLEQTMAPMMVALRESSMLMEIVRAYLKVDQMAAMRAGLTVGHSAVSWAWMLATATLWDLLKC